jgi:hypothetical protein
MISYSKKDNDSRIERVIVAGCIIGVIIRGSASAYFRARTGWGKLFLDASEARSTIEHAVRKRLTYKS